MNLLLLNPEEVSEACAEVVVRGRRADHLVEVVRVEPGALIEVGVLGGKLGTGRVVRVDGGGVHLEVALDRDPPPRLDLRLILALPRPKVLRRVLQFCGAAGVAAVHLINSWRVEKSYWGSPLLEAGAVERELVLGLEQGKDTILPEVFMHSLFKPFVEDTLPSVAAGTEKLLADPRAGKACPGALPGSVSLVVGPEGGLIPYEIDRLEEAGFEPVHLGPRPLRVEHAVAALAGRLMRLEGKAR